jgi:pyruvate dehydrogenase E1 component
VQAEGAKLTPRVQLLGSGTILRESMAAQELLEKTGAWPPTCGAAPASTSWPATARTPSAGTCCTRRGAARALRRAAAGGHAGPVVASTDYMKAYAEQIRPFIPKGRTYKVLGTDGFGRSDFRSKLREHFEVNRHYIVVAALQGAGDEGTVPAAKVAEAIKKYGIKADKINPLYA